MKIVHAMYRNVPSCLRSNSKFSDNFKVKVGIYRVLYRVCCIKALPKEFCMGCLEVILDADDFPVHQ